MAKFFRDTNGNHGLRQSAAEERLNPIPAGSTVIEFDETTNQAFLDSFAGRAGFRCQDHSIIAGKVMRAGVQYLLLPDGTDTAAAKKMRTLLTALDAGTANSRTVQEAVAFLIRQVMK